MDKCCVDLKTVKRRFALAEVEYGLLLSRNNSAYRHAIPNKSVWVNKAKGQRQDIEIYNGAPSSSVYKHAKSMTSILMPAGQRWFDLLPPEKLPSQIKEEIQPQLTDTADTAYDYLQMSKCRSSTGEAMQDLAIGTGGIHITYSGNQTNPLRISSLDISQMYFTESSAQLLDNVFRRIVDMDIEVAKALYPKADFGNCDIDDKKNTITFIEAVCFDESSVNEPLQKYAHYLYKDGGSDDDIYLYQELNYNPFILFRYDKRPNEFAGIGVITRRLGDIITANLMMKWLMIYGEMQATPPLAVAHNALINPHLTTFAPNEMIQVKADLGQPIQSLIQRLPPGGNPAFTLEMVQQINKQIDDDFAVNQLNYEGQPKTATEIQYKIKEAVNILSDVYNRLQDEYLSRLINTSLLILESHGLVNSIFIDNGIDKNGKIIKKKIKHQIRYSSPLDEIRQQANISKLVELSQIVGEIGGVQLLQASINHDMLATYIANNLGGIDKDLIRSPQEIHSVIQKTVAGIQGEQQYQQNAALFNQLQQQ